MLQDIFVGVMCAVVALVAIWGWWIENGPDRSKPEEKDEGNQGEDGSEKKKS